MGARAIARPPSRLDFRGRCRDDSEGRGGIGVRGIQRWNRIQVAGGVDATTLPDTYGYAISYEPAVADIFALAFPFLSFCCR